MGGKPVAERPLLAGDDPAGTLARLRSQRDRAYAGAASHTVDTTGRTPEEVAGLVLWWARLVPGLLTREERMALR
jgi:shikimate kinase